MVSKNASLDRFAKKRENTRLSERPFARSLEILHSKLAPKPIWKPKRRLVRAGTIYRLANNDILDNSLTYSQKLPKKLHGRLVLVLEVSNLKLGSGQLATFLPIVEGKKDNMDWIPNFPSLVRWYIPLQSEDHSAEARVIELKYGCKSNKAWARQWVDVSQIFKVEAESLLPYMEWKDVNEESAFSKDEALYLADQSLKALRLYARSVPGTLAWLPHKAAVSKKSIIFQQNDHPKFFNHPVVILNIDLSTEVVTFLLATTKGNTTFQDLNIQKTSDDFFNRVTRLEYMVLQDKSDKRENIGFSVVSPEIGKADYEERLEKQSYIELGTIYRIERDNLRQFHPNENSIKKVILDRYSLDALRAQVAKVHEHPLAEIILRENRSLCWHDITEGFVYFLPLNVDGKSLLHRQTNSAATVLNKLDLRGLPCLVVGKLNGMVKILPIWSNGEFPICKVNSQPDIPTEFSIPIEGYGAEPHLEGKVLRLAAGSAQMRFVSYVKVNTEYLVEYTNLKAWSRVPVYLANGEIGMIKHYRHVHSFDRQGGSSVKPQTIESIRGFQMLILGLATPQEKEKEKPTTPSAPFPTSSQPGKFTPSPPVNGGIYHSPRVAPFNYQVPQNPLHSLIDVGVYHPPRFVPSRPHFPGRNPPLPSFNAGVYHRTQYTPIYQQPVMAPTVHHRAYWQGNMPPPASVAYSGYPQFYSAVRPIRAPQWAFTDPLEPPQPPQ